MRQRLHDTLSAQAQHRPESTAVVWLDRATSYGELDQASNRLARALKTAGCQRGDRVALLLPKSTRALVAMFASLKADCIYVPIDTASPAARIESILRLCDCRCVLAERSTASLLHELASIPGLLETTRIGWMERSESQPLGLTAHFSWDEAESLSDACVPSASTAADPAHILFTSGSTGTPKGVVITHSNVANFIHWAVAYLGMGPADRISGHPPLHFDLSTFDIYGTIAAGAQIHLLSPEVSLLPHRLADFIRDSKLTQWFSVPSALVPLATFDLIGRDDFPALERLLWCGEKFPVPALTHWMQRLPNVAFVNLYGPTETTIASSYYRVAQCPAHPKAEIPIGEACAGEALMVLDDRMNPSPLGEIGDLYIGGVGLSPGYWKDPEKTREMFKRNPHSGNPHDRIYKTGDLAKVGPDGMIYLLGRSDSQIKSRGYRIELGEIEAALHATPVLRGAAVVALDAPGTDDKTICCAYVADENPGILALKKHLATIVPRYMIPARWMALQQMPLNGSGKIDRRLLKEWFRRETAESGSTVMALSQRAAQDGATVRKAG